MTTEYIEERNGGYYVAGTRVSLDSIVYSFRRGNSPETIKAEYPLLKLSQINGAIAFYVDHQEAIDQYLENKQREFEASAIPLSEANPELWAKLERARQATSSGRVRRCREASGLPGQLAGNQQPLAFLYDDKEIQKAGFCICVACSSHCRRTGDTEDRSLYRLFVLESGRATEGVIEIRHSEWLERFSEAQCHTSDRLACRFQRPLRKPGIDSVHDKQPNPTG